MGARATAFITEADGFVGTELIKVLVAGGHDVSGLVHSLEGAERVRRLAPPPLSAIWHRRGRGRTKRRLTGSFTSRHTHSTADE